EVAKRIANHRDYVSLPFHAILDADGKLLIDSESRFGNIGFPAGSYDGCRHLERMLKETRLTLTDQDVQQVLRTLDQ
ncbi:MAG: hypothetical protein KDA87_18865, partial [Planctomycetales bacterium]|nr:hypothetical protein [Planctomycetales bacterium]